MLSVQVASYIARIGVNATFMFAFGIPVTVRNIFLIIAANSISSTFAVTPGGVGRSRPSPPSLCETWHRRRP